LITTKTVRICYFLKRIETDTVVVNNNVYVQTTRRISMIKWNPIKVMGKIQYCLCVWLLKYPMWYNYVTRSIMFTGNRTEICIKSGWIRWLLRETVWWPIR